MATEKQARDAKRQLSAQILARPGVCGVGVEQDATGNYVVTVHLDTDDPIVRQALPAQVGGQAIRYVVSGPFEKH